MNILVTGSNGQLGSELRELEKEFGNHKFFFTDLNELDVTNADKTIQFVKSNKIEVAINCAAFTAVDLAESHKSEVTQINVIGAKNISLACAKVNALLIHISTDYVFEGKNFKPYTENDTAGPKTTYGKSKLDGEIEVIFNAKRALIFRTSWLFSSYGNNFVKTIYEKAKKEKELKVVYDQIGSPTYAGELARVIMEIIPKVPQKIRTEIYNFSNEGVASWYDFAHAIVNIKKLPCSVIPVLSKEFPTEAIRPFYSVLNKSRVKKDFGITLPHWRDSLEVCLSKM